MNQLEKYLYKLRITDSGKTASHYQLVHKGLTATNQCVTAAHLVVDDDTYPSYLLHNREL